MLGEAASALTGWLASACCCVLCAFEISSCLAGEKVQIVLIKKKYICTEYLHYFLLSTTLLGLIVMEKTVQNWIVIVRSFIYSLYTRIKPKYFSSIMPMGLFRAQCLFCPSNLYRWQTNTDLISVNQFGHSPVNRDNSPGRVRCGSQVITVWTQLYVL